MNCMALPAPLSGKELSTLLDDVLAGYRLSVAEAASLFKVKGRDVWRVAAAADEQRARIVGDVVTYVRNQNINVTNLCINSCGFCGFSRKPGDPDAYYHSPDMVKKKAAEALARDVTEICTVSGLHPDFDAGSYLQIIENIREGAPGVHIHASNPMEVAYGAKKSGISTREMLSLMKDAGLGSLCGTAAEILVDDVRKVICPGKISSQEWERIIREAHALGIRTTATIMYGHCETEEDRAWHLGILRRSRMTLGALPSSSRSASSITGHPFTGRAPHGRGRQGGKTS